MIPAIKELNFPKKDGKQYASLSQAEVQIEDMGERTITSTLKIDGNIAPDFSFDWEIEFQGEKYIMPLRIPQGAKENTSLDSTIDLTFQHWAIYQLKRWPFVTIQWIEAGTYLADEEEASVSLNLEDFCTLFGQVLEYYYGNAITIDLNPEWESDSTATVISISHTKIWNVLSETLYDKFGVRWVIEAASDNSNTVKGGERYVIRVGYPTTEVDHIFEYGFEGGLLKVERQVQSEEIRNMLKGRGGEKNIPLRYFKNTDPNNPDFEADPDWVEELENIYFPNLMGATFRSYIQGWKAQHISDYPGYTAVGESNAYSAWAYRKGYTDTKFSPVEFVADEIVTEAAVGDRYVEILPGYAPAVKKGSSIDKYGPLPDTLDNNDDIYPTIQGTGLDIVVDVEQIGSDNVAESVESDARLEDKTYPDIVKRNIPQGHATAADASKRTYFTVPTGKEANIEGYAGAKAYNPQNHEDKSAFIAELDYTINVFNATTGKQHPASGIPEGDWYFTVEYSFNNTTSEALNVTLSFNEVKIVSATPSDKWRNTFDIWIKNIWDSAPLSGEFDSQYAERVWAPVLGDREKNTAKVVFTSGALAVSEDYEFTIVGFPVPDSTKAYKGEQSHWRLTLAKSEAELEATGLYVPSTQKQGKAGDAFAFIGTEMTHVPYVVDAEIRLDGWKRDQLGEVKEIKPTAVVTTDRVRLNNKGESDALINQLRIGDSLRVYDKRFLTGEGKAYETLYLQSIKYTYRTPTNDDAALNPDVELTLGNDYTVSANPVSMMQGDISALQRQVGSISNVEQIVRAVGDKLYLRKDGITDRSLSSTQFFSLLTSGNFRAGLIGGSGWGFYKDENGSWVLETDRLNVRQDMNVNTLVINQAEGRGGMEISTAAYIDGVTRVEETVDGYVCYFDQKEGSVANLFKVGDVAFCNRWTPENAQLKSYKRRVVKVEADSVTLTKELNEDQRPQDWPDSGVNGTGVPAEGDNIIHFGNYTDKTRQYIKVRDVVGGGYERYIEALNSVNAAGVEYYFVGKQAGESRWFVGNKDLVPYSGAGDGSYIEYINRKFNLNNVSLSTNTTVGDKTLEAYIKLISPPVNQEDIENYVTNVVKGLQDQIDGVIETWFAEGVPTLDNYPASEWDTENLKIAHLGDLYYDNKTGTAYRFSQNPDKTYFWAVITDDAITKALAAAQNALNAANGKRRVFTEQPTPPYDKGDLWANATYPTGTTKDTRDPENGKYYEDILRCSLPKPSGESFDISDWRLASNYTDDSLAQEAKDEIAGYKYLKEAIANGATQLYGGLLLSSHIRLGEWDKTDPTNPVMTKVYAGMNGIYNDGRTIASWWGGNMVDLFDANDNRIDPVPANAATSLIRMDGSAYFAAGNVGFKKDGGGWLAGDNITWDATGAITFGNGIKIDLGGGEGTTLGDLDTKLTSVENSVSTVLELANKLSNLFTPFLGNQATTWAKVKKDGDYDNIRVNVGAWTESFLSARGRNDSGTSGGGAVYLHELLDTVITKPASGEVLTYNGQKWVNQAAQTGLDESALATYLAANNYAKKTDIPSLTGYATQTWVQQQGYLTAHQTIRTLTIQKNGTSVGTFNPADSANTTLNITDVASASTMSSHIADTTAHITSGERTKWNKVVSDFAAITGADSDSVINKWEEVVAFLDTYTEADTLANLLSNKADKTTSINAGTGLTGGGTLAASRTLSLAASGVTAGTYFKTTVDTYGRVTSGSNPTMLSGFGITDAYTKTEADGRYVNLTGAQTISGAKTFSSPIISTFKSDNWLNGTKNAALTLNHSNYGAVWCAPVKDGRVGLSTYPFSDNNVYLGYAPTGQTSNSLLKSLVWTADTGNLLVDSLNTASIVIGGCTITWDATNGMLKFDKGVYSEGAVSALGANPNSGGGGSGLIQTVYAYKYLGGDTFSNNTVTDTFNAYTINRIYTDLSSRISSLEGGSALSVVTTGGGNAITDISKSGTVITATKGATFLTAHQSLANYVTLDTEQTITGAKTFTKDIVLRNEKRICAYMPRKSSELTGGWASHPLLILDAQGDDFAHIGICGLENNLSYIYIGANRYSDQTNLRISPKGIVSAAGFAKFGGTSSQFLKADGSVDANTYLTTSSAASSYVTALGTSGNYLTWTKNGTTNNITVPYATASTIASRLSGGSIPTWGTLTAANGYSNVASYDYGTTGTFAWAGKNGQMSMQIDGFFYQNEGRYRCLDTNNYASVLDSRYYTEAEVNSLLSGKVSKSGDTMTGPLYLGMSSANVFADNNNGAWLQYHSQFLNITDDGLWHNDIYKIWDSGNDGSGSGLDADLLDGMQGSAYAQRNAWNDMINSSNEFTFVSPAYSGDVWVNYRTASGTTDGNITGYKFGNGKGGALAEIKAGSFSGNAASATRLQGTYSLWGQSFYGNNVSGDMTGVGSISASGTITGASGHLGDIYFMESDEINRFGDALYLQHRGGGLSGYGSTGNVCMCANGGNVGIGTTAPSRPLEVVGDIRAQNGWLRTSGAKGWYSDTYSGGWYMTDSTWVRSYNGKGIYTESGVIRTDGAFQIGDAGSVFHAQSNGNVTASGTITGSAGNFGTMQINSTLQANGPSYLYGNVYQKYFNYYQRNTKGVYIGVDDDDNFVCHFHENQSWTKGGFKMFYEDQKMQFWGPVYSVVGVYSDGYVSARGQNTSDARLKTDIRDFCATDIIRSLRPKAFRWNAEARSKFKVLDTDDVQYGLVAQETELTNPWLVDRDMFGDGYMGIRYEKLIPVLLKGEIEIVRLTESLETRVKRLEKENEELKLKIESLTN